MTITKRVLASEVAQRTGCKMSLVMDVVDALFESLSKNIINKNRIEIRGFGSFTVKETRPRTAARNPRTDEKIFVPARHKVTFKPAKAVKDILDEPI